MSLKVFFIPNVQIDYILVHSIIRLGVWFSKEDPQEGGKRKAINA